MSGDIYPDKTPRKTLIKDSLEKLNISNVEVLENTQTTSEEVDVLVTRYIFIYVGNYLGLSLDERKYDESSWVSKDELAEYDVTPHALHVLKAIGFMK